MVSQLLPLILAALLQVSGAAEPPGHEAHPHEAAEQLGKVSFPVSCRPDAQRAFNHAVAWLHSFEYEEAERVFVQSAEADPRCAMSHWGVAMSQYHPLWAPPTPAELEKGRRAIERAAGLGEGSPRERDYIAALAAFYSAEHKDHAARTLAHASAMEQLHRRHPSDREAAVFYALSLVAAGMIDDDRSFAREKTAAALLDEVLAREPDHPGVAHYLIHSYDYPQLAHLALPAARRYAGIAPASAHAQHMPSHIFTRMGLWNEAIESNLGAEAAARAYAKKHNLLGSWDERLHAMDYLAYAYLQGGQDAKARAVLDELNRIERVDPANLKVAYAFTAIPARLALERRQWREAAALSLAPGPRGAVPWTQFRWAEANLHFARAVGAARSGDAATARSELAALESIRQGVRGGGAGYDWGLQVEIQHRIAAAWAEAAEGRPEDAVRLMRAAADLDDVTEKHPVTPGPILPAREQLGELLLQLGRPAEALTEFEIALGRAPRRFNGVLGAARAARATGDMGKAGRFYGMLLELGANADAGRPEIAEARAFAASSAPETAD